MASSEMRRWPPAVQAANVPACEPLPRLLTAGRSILLPEEGRLSAWVSYGGESRGFALTWRTVDHRGRRWSKPTSTRAGRLRIWRTCGCRAGVFTERRRDTRTSTSLDVARCRGPRVHRAPAIPHPRYPPRSSGKMNAGDPGAWTKIRAMALGWLIGCLKS